MLYLISGGVRSNKSSFAEGIIGKYNEKHYIATLYYKDKEMIERIKKHQERRDGSWFTHEIPYNLKADKIFKDKHILLDCLTNLVTNEIIKYDLPVSEIITKIFNELKDLCYLSQNLVIVTNNCFEEIDNYSPLTIKYLKILGKLNLLLAKEANYVYECTSGICQLIKEERNE